MFNELKMISGFYIIIELISEPFLYTLFWFRSYFMLILSFEEYYWSPYCMKVVLTTEYKECNCYDLDTTYIFGLRSHKECLIILFCISSTYHFTFLLLFYLKIQRLFPSLKSLFSFIFFSILFHSAYK